MMQLALCHSEYLTLPPTSHAVASPAPYSPHAACTHSTPHAPCPSPSPFAFAIQGVRALPSFHFWKGSKQVDSISGAKAQTLQDAIETHMN